MNALKGVVIVMSLAIAILLSLMVYGLYQKSQNPDFKFFKLSGTDKAVAKVMVPEVPVSGAPKTEKRTFGDVALNLLATARIVSVTAADNRLIVVVATQGTIANQVWVIDMQSGKILGTVNTGP